MAIAELHRVETATSDAKPSKTVSSLRRILVAVAILDVAVLGLAARKGIGERTRTAQYHRLREVSQKRR